MPSGLIFPFFFGIITRRSGRAEYPRLFNDAIALVFALDVFQVSLSTPGLFLPLFSVTRLTANARPLTEWVSSHCRAFTLLWRPACCVFTIRVCSRLTCRWTWAQLMPSHVKPEGARACVAALICFPSVRMVLKTLW